MGRPGGPTVRLACSIATMSAARSPLPDHSFADTNSFAVIPDAGSVFCVGAGRAIFSSEDNRRLEQALTVGPYGDSVLGPEPLIGRWLDSLLIATI